MLLVALTCAMLTALVPANPSGIELLIIPAILVLFLGGFILAELVPGGRRERTLLAPRRLFPLAVGALLISALYLLLGERPVERLFLNGSRIWLVIIFAFAFLGLVTLLKRLVSRRR